MHFTHQQKAGKMKKICTLLLFSVATFATSFAQTGATTAAADGQRSYGERLPPIQCAGNANMQSVDLNWQPILVNKPTEVHMPSPHQDVLDRIKAEKLKEKLQYEKEHGITAGKTTAVNPVMGTNFAGQLNSGMSPLDNSIAVSDSGYIVSVSNSRIAFYRSNGTSLYNNSLAAFMPFGGTPVSNPVVLYDTRANRFIMVCQQYPIIDTGKIFICFSQTAIPTGGWWCYALRGNPAGGGSGFDFPRIAVNDSELFVTGNLYAAPGTSSTYFEKPIIFQMDKLAGYSGASMSSIYYPFIFGNPFSILPVSDGQTSGITTGMKLIATTDTGGSYITTMSITGHWSAFPSISYSSASTSAYRPAADARQLGSSALLDVGDCRALSGFLLDGKIHFTFNTDAGSGYCGINYNRLNVAAGTNVSTTLGATGFDYAYPSVVSYATTTTNPSVIIGFGRTGSTIYPEIRAVNCDSVGAWSATTLVKSSVSYAGSTTGVTRWGNYTGTARRHNSAAPSVWMNGMFANTAHNWDTWVAEIHDAITTPCVPTTTTPVTAITATTATLHWTVVGGATYNIRYRPQSASTWSTTTSTALFKVLTALMPATLYEYEVQSMCSDSTTTAYTATDTFRTKPFGVSVTDPGMAANARVYPNPVVSGFVVDFTLAHDCTLAIDLLDISGRVVKELYAGKGATGNNEFSFSKATLSKGIYFLRIAADGNVVKNEKIIVAE